MGRSALNNSLREVICSILADTAPQPWSTPDLRAAFAPLHYQRVYVVLRQLENQGLVGTWRTSDCAWWWWRNPDPACGNCGRKATELVRIFGRWNSETKEYEYLGGYTCSRRECRLATLVPWPWPSPRGTLVSR